MNRLCTLITVYLALCVHASTAALGAELATLSPATWDAFAPQGKEVDSIYGDLVLRNEQIVAVLGNPIPGRNANMTVRGVGGMLIDLTKREPQSDQLSAFYPGGGRITFNSPERMRLTGDGAAIKKDQASGKSLAVSFQAKDAASKLSTTTTYTVSDGQPYVAVETKYENPGDKPVTVSLTDSLRADRTFIFGTDVKTHLFWAYDEWFEQAYGIVSEDFEIRKTKKKEVRFEYVQNGKGGIEISAGQSFTLKRRIIPAAHLLELRGIANKLVGVTTAPVAIRVLDPAGPVRRAKVTLHAGDTNYGHARTPASGELKFAVPPGNYDVTVEALGRPNKKVALDTSKTSDLKVQLEACGYVVGKITDDDDGPIPCKVAFHGIDGTSTPFFAPDSEAVAVHNLHYSHDGRIRQEIGPGKYEVLISRGPEYDVVAKQIEVMRGKETKLVAKLIQTVDTSGWISADFHSHSSPSGDNTGSQFGRVLNLLAEHIEFAPCTEHNRIDSYVPHLKRLGTEHLMATCTGIELTGQPLPINHQNAFPLVHKHRTQDGGAPQTHVNPLVQIERLAMWDNSSEKLVQGNHPNLVQILGDRDLNGKYDGGFSGMLPFMDVVEVHPPADILKPPTDDPLDKRARHPIFHWMQMLNLGFRIPGVVNTDAHYNFHGSGGLRNYIKSPTDNPAEVKTLDVVHTAEHGNMVMTTGPFMEVSLRANQASDNSQGIPGDDVIARGGKATLHVRVQCPNWLDVNRVQVFLNGSPSKELNFLRRQAPERFANGVVKFDQRIELALEQDTHVIVAAAGEGLQVGRVMGPSWGKQLPIAVSNPIFVDVDGEGFKPNKDLLGLPLPSSDE